MDHLGLHLYSLLIYFQLQHECNKNTLLKSSCAVRFQKRLETAVVAVSPTSHSKNNTNGPSATDKSCGTPGITL